MNKWQKEVQKSLLESEEAAIKELEKQYKASLNEINQKVKLFEADIRMLDEAINTEGIDEAAKARLQSQKRSKVYQKQYQEALQGQISGILDRMHGNNYSTIESYLKGCYEDAFIGTMYDIHGQGIPLIMPIDQAAAVKAVLTDSKVVKGYYDALGVDINNLKKVITQEVSRGIASSLSYSEIARNINNASKTGLYNAKRIARTEGHRIQQQSADDARKGAISRGCDVVKQWDSTLDGKTRPNHRRLDGQIREEDEPFEVAGMKAKYPGDFGDPAEDCNCRCVALTRARWALDEDELKTLQERAEYFGLDKSKQFEEYKEKYLQSTSKMAAQSNENDWSQTAARNVTAKEKQEVIKYANGKGVDIGDIDTFDGDIELLKSEIDTISKACDEYGIINKITVSSKVLEDDEDFAITDGYTITFNSKALRNRVITELNIISGQRFASRTVEDIALHEIGHIFAKEKGINGLAIAKAAYYNKFEEHLSSKRIKEVLEKEVSRYCKAATSEIVAEVFVSNKYNPTPFSVECMRLLKEVLFNEKT